MRLIRYFNWPIRYRLRCTSARIVGILGVVAYVTLVGVAGGSLASAQLTTLELVKRSITGFPHCLDYTIRGFTIRATVKPWGVEVFATPHVTHNWCDLIDLVHPRIEDSAWDDWDRVFGIAQQHYMALSMALVLGTPPSADGAGGGNVEYKLHGRHQAQGFGESQNVGHPLAIIPKLLDTYTSGSVNAVDLESSSLLPTDQGLPSLADYTQWLTGAGLDAATTEELIGIVSQNIGLFDLLPAMPAIANPFSIGDWMEQLDEIMPIFEQFADLVIDTATDLGVDAGVGYGIRIDRIFCRNPVIPFVPYYMSGVDWIFWREGWPMTDIDYTPVIVNPLPTRVVARPGLLEIWGNIYPRHGFVDHAWSAKAAAVNAVQSVMITTDEKTFRLRIPLPGGQSGKWRKTFPELSGCSYNITRTGTRNQDREKYVWDYWRDYECDLSDAGVKIGYIPIPPVEIPFPDISWPVSRQ